MSWWPLKRFCIGGPQYGMNTPASEYRSDGMRFIRTTDIVDVDTLTASNAVYVDPAGVGSEHILRDGDLLFSRSGTLGRCLRYQQPEVASTFAGYLVRFRPRPDLASPRYLAYCAQAAFFQEAIAADAISSTISNFNAEKYAELRLPWWPLASQVAIADFLDRETARIDALIAAKRRMIALVTEGLDAAVSTTVWSGAVESVPLKRRVDPLRPIMYGIVLPGPDVPTGVPIVKGGDVAGRRLLPEQLNRTTFEIELPYARARLAGGDLVFAIRGGIGDVEVVPRVLAGANITQDVARIAPRSDVDPEWLRLVLRSHQVRRQVGERTTGATVRGLNIADLREVMIPPSDPLRQAEDLHKLMPKHDRVHRLCLHLRRQIELLAEHRQALVTAAVTGEINVVEMAA